MAPNHHLIDHHPIAFPKLDDVGDGNSAGQAAVYLSERARKVLLLILGDDLGKHMSHYLTRRIEQTTNIEVRRQTQISRMHGDKSLVAVELTSSQTDQSDTVECPAVFVFIGSVPHTRWLPRGDGGGVAFMNTWRPVKQRQLSSASWPVGRFGG